MKTLYISDLDGTLLNKDTVLSDFTIHTLNSLIDQGMLFSIATARTPATVMRLLEKVNLQLPLVLLTGAVIFNPISKTYDQIQSFENSVINAILFAIKDYNVSVLAHTIKDNYLNVYYKFIATSFEENFISIRQNSGYKDFVQISSYEPVLVEGRSILISILNKIELLNEIKNRLTSIEEIHVYCYKDLVNPEYGYLEIFPKQTSKASAIGKLAKELEIERIISFGDNVNDISMFEISHEAYAVENGVEKAKAAASGIIGGNDYDGVARFLQQQFQKLRCNGRI